MLKPNYEQKCEQKNTLGHLYEYIEVIVNPLLVRVRLEVVNYFQIRKGSNTITMNSKQIKS